MATRTREKLLTADEFYRLSDPIEGGKMELVRGRVVTKPPMGWPHGRCQANLVTGLFGFAHEHELGEVLVSLGYLLARSPDVVRAPDVSFVSRENLESNTSQTYFDGPPRLAIEVLSSDDTWTEILTKVGEYLDAGAARAWVADPRTRTVTVHRDDGSSATFREGDNLSSDDAGFAEPGFDLPVASLFD